MLPIGSGWNVDHRWLWQHWLFRLAVVVGLAVLGACAAQGTSRGITFTLNPWKPGAATISGTVTNPSTNPCSDVGIRVTFKDSSGKTLLTVRDDIGGIGSTTTHNWTLYIGTPHANTEPAGVLAIPRGATSADVIGRCDDEGPGLP